MKESPFHHLRNAFLLLLLASIGIYGLSFAPRGFEAWVWLVAILLPVLIPIFAFFLLAQLKRKLDQVKPPFPQ